MMRQPISIGVLAVLVLTPLAPDTPILAQAAASTACASLRQEFTASDTARGEAAGSATASHFAIHARSRGCPTLAVDLYELAAARAPVSAPVWLSYATEILVGTLHEPDSAVAIVARASDAAPDDVDLLDLRGAVDLAVAHWDDAHCAYARLVAVDSTSSTAWAGLARASDHAGHGREAVAYWTRLNLVAPSYLTDTTNTTDRALYAASHDTTGDVPPATVWLTIQDGRRHCDGML
jgi:tetratricopeptide (TPR) repeat protein